MRSTQPVWKHDSELALLRDYFYPQQTEPDPFAAPGTDQRRAAIDLVSAYIFRDPRTPHALTATANLTDAVLHHEQYERRKYISDTSMRSIYAMAFVKFVNGFIDRDVARLNIATLATSEAVANAEDGANDPSDDDEMADTSIKSKVKGKGESSMYAFAVQIGMPEDFVDLRHNIVHGDIPSLSVLQAYNDRALQWLWKKWWLKNATGDATEAREEELEQKDVVEVARRRSARDRTEHDGREGSPEGLEANLASGET